MSTIFYLKNQMIAKGYCTFEEDQKTVCVFLPCYCSTDSAKPLFKALDTWKKICTGKIISIKIKISVHSSNQEGRRFH